MEAAKVAYSPVGLLARFAGGMLAGVVFTRLWKLVTHGDAPDVLDEERGWGEALAAAALHGAIFAVVRGAIKRSGAVGVRGLTGTWPSH
ncbi:DUF4235 domain-containing protein [Streptomyces sp. NBC_01190]|uniref:DUF4235 domain-containing protein n=1 Tax=Streptomyces sp. NBC_01190 TaxID=2903767 RepID=UPI003868C371|nr:DUF4235 domain-containing protein [Streptomyces sp. NBC_01190]